MTHDEILATARAARRIIEADLNMDPGHPRAWFWRLRYAWLNARIAELIGERP